MLNLGVSFDTNLAVRIRCNIPHLEVEKWQTSKFDFTKSTAKTFLASQEIQNIRFILSWTCSCDIVLFLDLLIKPGVKNNDILTDSSCCFLAVQVVVGKWFV